MKLLKKPIEEAQPGETAFAQRLGSITTRHKIGTALYDSAQDAPSNRE